MRARGLLVLAAIGSLLAAGTGGIRLCAAGDSPSYMGAENCKKCHLIQFDTWKASKMSSSFEALKPCDMTTYEGKNLAERRKTAKLDPDKDYRTDPKCLKCHTTGYGQPGGYPEKVTDENRELAGKREGVQCEACHGPGSKYVPFLREAENEKYKRSEIRKLGLSLPNKDTCLRCHNLDSPFAPKEFDFEDRKARGTHKHVALKFDHDG
jgi:hypothetical protein